MQDTKDDQGPAQDKKGGHMAKVELHPWIEEIHGTLGDLVFKKSPQGEMIVTKRPDMSNVKWSKAQKANRNQFKEGIAYARAAIADPETCAYYETKAENEGRIPFRVALSDYLAGNNRLKQQ
jgi:hypothetical protein